jgi:hypothetical protein
MGELLPFAADRSPAISGESLLLARLLDGSWALACVDDVGADGAIEANWRGDICRSVATVEDVVDGFACEDAIAVDIVAEQLQEALDRGSRTLTRRQRGAKRSGRIREGGWNSGRCKLMYASRLDLTAGPRTKSTVGKWV